ncbi:hypothetical protein DPMN_160972 [Dreissena polymorpha]|uniref:Uncharacterized protein n=1 Tax=Dreissena polymorpha TaxID=45954 RepID=A0A9D4ES69_DREPO|nr:hypothetical protein DPMN_160972 [Dreissena polymorpha]
MLPTYMVIARKEHRNSTNQVNTALRPDRDAFGIHDRNADVCTSGRSLAVFLLRLKFVHLSTSRPQNTSSTMSHILHTYIQILNQNCA